MNVDKLSNMKRGWFIGDFKESVLRTKEFEACCRFYEAGYEEEGHIHKILTEITVVTSGKIILGGQEFGPGSIVTVNPNESAPFKALEDCTLTIIKVPSIPGDKYPTNDSHSTQS